MKKLLSGYENKRRAQYQPRPRDIELLTRNILESPRQDRAMNQVLGVGHAREQELKRLHANENFANNSMTVGK
jgi:hypothetical protein